MLSLCDLGPNKTMLSGEWWQTARIDVRVRRREVRQAQPRGTRRPRDRRVLRCGRVARSTRLLSTTTTHSPSTSWFRGLGSLNMSKKPSPHRRRSIAVLGHGQAKPSSRRRAYSIAPGERLSPSAKARRLLVRHIQNRTGTYSIYLRI